MKLGAGFAMAAEMAMEAMMKKVFRMMDDLVVLECWMMDRDCI